LIEIACTKLERGLYRSDHLAEALASPEPCWEGAARDQGGACGELCPAHPGESAVPVTSMPAYTNVARMRDQAVCAAARIAA
jgi:hypothetical protein